MKIVVIGGTGLIGSKTVAILRQGGHEVVAAAPKSGINTITGGGLKERDRSVRHGQRTVLPARMDRRAADSAAHARPGR